MGMFDEVRCLYPLEFPEVQNELFQSKGTPVQWLDLYEIRADGTLWHQAYDRRVEVTDDSPLGCWLHRDNPRWEQEILDGEIEIHTSRDEGPTACAIKNLVWYSFRFWFRDGIVQDVVAKRSEING